MNTRLLMAFSFLLTLCWGGKNVQAQETITKKRQLLSVADRTAWKLTASSAQALSDGGNGGPATLLIDGKSTSYWHSVWDTNVLPGATIDVDFGKTQTVSAVLIQQRDMEARKIKGIKLYFKANVADAWGTAKYTGTLTNVVTMQTIKLSTKQTVRFMRLEIISKIDGTPSNACLAELGIEVEEAYVKSEYDAMSAFLELPVNATTDKVTVASRTKWTTGEPKKITAQLMVNPGGINTNEAAATKNITLNTNTAKWTAWKSADWLTLKENRAENANSIEASIMQNDAIEKRTDTLFVSGAGILRKILINQSGIQVPAEMIPTDIYIKPSGGQSTSQYDVLSVSNLWDRNTTNGPNYHSAVNSSGAPATEVLDFYFSQKLARMDYMFLYPAGAGSNCDFTISYKTDGASAYTDVPGTYQWSSGSARKYIFPVPLQNVTAVKLKLIIPNGSFACGKELEFYTINNEAPLYAALLNVFTDLSCSAIKADASQTNVDALPAFFQYIYNKLKNNTYEKAYRIDAYEAYSDPDKFAGKRGTNAYSVLDNPTGIYANQGDDVYVLVGDTHGTDISLLSVSAGSLNRDTYSLKQGINKIKITRAGLLYVSYFADLNANPQPINIHFPEGSGKVNGYWDITKNTDAEWRAMLSKAKHPVIDIVGRKFQAVLYVDELVKNFSYTDGDKISKSVEIWDGLVESGWKFMGFDKYTLPQNNRMCGINFDGDGHMWATWYTTGYNRPTTVGEVLYPGIATGNRLWGIGHEVGHCQQHPFNWRSMSESSNNTFAQIALEEVINGPLVRNITDVTLDNAATDMEPPLQGINPALDGTPLHDLGGWEKWGNSYYQFYLYFVKLGINPDFYKDMFESLRQTGLGSDYYVGERQLNWYKRVCDVAKTDFTEHFEANGYFTPINKTGNQYGDYRITITQAEAEAAKAYVASKNYPKPKFRTQFLHQHGKIKPVTSLNGYWTYYRDNAPLRTDIACTVSGATVRVANGKEAAAFAVETDGKIVYYADRASFTVPAAKWNATSKVYAVPLETAQPLVQIYPK